MRPVRTPCARRLGETIRHPDHAAYGELDTSALLLYCSAQFAPDRPAPALPAPSSRGGAT
ncbi:hypothetical protein BED46_022555 [Burkholderia contaminans]|uniref:Uncharacterized protein n=1 Tax=Burkholderia contaminans LMG 23361 TaxID=1334628 RepID=A0ABD4AZK1_9BURK|nr:hypothetical protein WR31_06890 [Burkholderia contaminans LMG 23361]MBA9832986.1 hypothetical protein [Burkholderia contaminans]MBA9843340.1 hypothetical protein [Burkholderia contaminans]MBA9866398.1 hypothetical protein [Burkholderia contaminans]MBA9909100.1 hypothetical protein [Burkholderia contaminans]